MKNSINFFYTFGAIVFLAAIDQASKYIIRLRQPADGGFYVCNPDIAFGIRLPEAVFWFFWLTIMIIIGNAFRMAVVEEREKNSFKIWGLTLVLAGALANIIDRLALGCVVDFIDLKFWPVFNLADIFIVSGALLWLAKFRKM